MARIDRIIPELSWQQLQADFFIGVRVAEQLKRDNAGKIVFKDGEPVVIKVGKQVNELQEAIDDGRLDALFTRCANELHGGDLQEAYAHFALNLNSVKAKRKAADTLDSTTLLRLNTLQGFLKDRREKRAAQAGKLPQWAYGPAEIDEIKDPEHLRKVINSIADVCSDKPGRDYASRLGEDYIEVAKANREYARERMASLTAPAIKVEDATLAKLSTEGKAVVLTAAQAAELYRLLKGE